LRWVLSARAADNVLGGIDTALGDVTGAVCMSSWAFFGTAGGGDGERAQETAAMLQEETQEEDFDWWWNSLGCSLLRL
jgi:hypothetical protein